MLLSMQYTFRFNFKCVTFAKLFLAFKHPTMEELIRYILEFLLGNKENEALIPNIGYCANKNEYGKYKLVIVKSNFFDSNIYGTSNSLPKLPFIKLENTAILFGKALVEKEGDTIILHADIIAGSFFLLSRYEEWICENKRDKHGRFIGKESIAYKANFLHKPLVDEYGFLLRKLLRESGLSVSEPESRISKVNLTHDVDIPLLYACKRHLLKAAIRSFKNKNTELIKAIRSYRGNFEQDSAYTFPWIIAQNHIFKKSYKGNFENIFFFKAAVKIFEQDKPTYDLKNKAIQQLFSMAKNAEASIGLHASYRSGDEPQLIAMEKERLEMACNVNVEYNRHHYLRIKEVEDLEYLLMCGISDDFTMGYPDVAGFRLGTSRAVKWINPATKKIRPLTLHPLTIMDVSLTDKRYMDLDFDAAYEYCQNLIYQTEKHAGELSLLWHNSSLKKTDIENRKLYSKLLQLLANAKK